ncbi:unnamed protein product [Vitrella brassicaformis CCMP3155]|uniref:FZ domain-containing protein n=1 Tax=Vitrella brassicaformis (strain CCMP3155) TaxID=1169540 RepID=A0A0G4EEE8_VITBC|nr:unnamed protein product [Vitrella brassicaformis CCMP3155]|eukprot:CEL93763.1 unnamed protein product [Vitrella brassicaformis CCMP3155]
MRLPVVALLVCNCCIASASTSVKLPLPGSGTDGGGAGVGVASLDAEFPSPALKCGKKGGVLTCLEPLGPVAATHCFKSLFKAGLSNLLVASAHGELEGLEELVEDTLESASTPDIARAACNECFANHRDPDEVCQSRLCYLTSFTCATNFIGETCEGWRSLPGIPEPQAPVIDPSLGVAECSWRTSRATSRRTSLTRLWRPSR